MCISGGFSQSQSPYGPATETYVCINLYHDVYVVHYSPIYTVIMILCRINNVAGNLPVIAKC